MWAMSGCIISNWWVYCHNASFQLLSFWPQDVHKLIFITTWWKKHCNTATCDNTDRNVQASSKHYCTLPLQPHQRLSCILSHKANLGGNRFTTDGIKTEVRELEFTFISKTKNLIPFYEKSVVIYILIIIIIHEEFIKCDITCYTFQSSWPSSGIKTNN